MRKQFLIPLLLLGLAASVRADVSGHTFFSVRPVFQTTFPEKVTLFRNDRAKAREDGWMGAMQAVVFGGRSTKSRDLAKFFLPFGKDSLIFAELAAPGVGAPPAGNPYGRDVVAENFNIATASDSFKSQVSFRPRQTFVGAGFDWIQYIGWGCEPCDKRWWFEVSFPVVNVKNDMRLTETILNQGTPFSVNAGNLNTSVAEAFTGVKGLAIGTGNAVTGSGWQFGKIDGSRNRTGVADVELKLGYDWICCDDYHAYSYVGLVVPTGNKPKGEYVFEPIVGNNRHFGVMWGTAFGFEWWRSCDGDKALNWEFELNGRYLFRNTQTRSFDLYNKQWSRYQVVYRNFADAASQAAFEGINVFTQRVRVKPRFSMDLNSGFVFTACRFEGELGFNFWARQGETAKLKDPFPTTISLAAIPLAAATISRAITIREQFTGALPAVVVAAEYATNAIQEQDINFESVAHPCAISHTAYGSMGYTFDWCWPIFVGVGGSYEFSALNTALNRWMVWGKIGVSI